MEFKVTKEGALFDAAQQETILKEEIAAYLTSAVKRMEAAVAVQIPVNTGHTRGSVFSAVRGVSQGRGEAVVSLPVEHAEALESGSKPHWAPIAPLLLWATQRYRDKGGSVRVTVKTIQWARKLPNRAAAIKSFAYAVQAAIAKRGTRALHMFALTQAAFEPILMREWESVKDKISQRLSEKK